MADSTIRDQTDSSFEMLRTLRSEIIDIENGFSSKSLESKLHTIKLFGVLFLLAICVVPGYVLIGIDSMNSEQVVKPNLNQTMCQEYIQQFLLTNSVYVTVCNINGYVFLDIRKFINGNATIIGISLNVDQWMDIKRLMLKIDIAVKTAYV